MLQLYVYGPTENGWLQLPPETTLQIEEQDDLFADEESTVAATYSIPITIPWTPHNRRLLGFAERLRNFNPSNYTYRVDAYDKGWLELSGGKLTLLEKLGDHTFRRGNFQASISGVRGRLGQLLKNKRMPQLNLGGDITYTTESRVFAQQVMEGLFPQYNYIQFVPVAFENFFDQQRPDYDNEFLALDTVNNIILNDTGWVFGRPRSTNRTVPTGPGEREHADYRTIPFLRYQYVLRACFESFGFTVGGDFINDPAWADLLLFNNFALEKYPSSTYEDVNRTLRPGNHVPDVLVEEFIDATLRTFKLRMRFTGANAVELKYKRRSLQQRTAVDITPFAGAEFRSVLPGANAQDGVTIKYGWDSNDQYPNERLKELRTRNFAASVSLLSQLPTLNIGRQLTTDDYVYCQQDNCYYLVADATNPANIRYDCWAENLYPAVTGAGEREVELPISTLFQYVEFVPSLAVAQRRNYLGCRQTGSYTNNAGNPVISPFGIRVFFGGLTTMFGSERPASWNWNRHFQNIPLGTYNLSLQGPGSLGRELVQDWEQFLTSIEVVEQQMFSNRRLNYLLQQTDQVSINGVVYFKSRRERSIPAELEEKLFLVPLTTQVQPATGDLLMNGSSS